MNKLKKLLAVSTIVTTFFGMTVVVNPASAAVAADGDLIKMSGNPAVYYLKGGKRYAFPNEKVYKTYYSDWNGVKVIPNDEMYSYTLSGNVMYRAGSKLVKITTVPTVYAVEPNGVLRSIVSEANATALWGANWNKMVHDVDDTLFTNYNVGQPLTAGVYPVGQVVKMSSSNDLFYWDGTNYRKFANEAAMLANGFKMENVAVTSMNITAGGAAISGAETGLMGLSLTGSSSTVYTGGKGLTVALAQNTAAAANVPQSAVQVPFLSFNVTASNDGAVTLRTVTVTRGGIGNADDFSGVYLYDGATRLTTARTVNTSTNKATFTGLNYTVPAGQTKTLTLKADMASSGINNNYFAISAASDIDTGGATVSGSFPVMGNTMVGVSQTVGNVAIERTDSNPLTSPKAGETGAKVAAFKLTANSVEDIEVKAVTLYQVGNIANDKMSNFTLKQAGTTVASATSMTGSNVVLSFNSPLKMEKGTSKTFELYADINSTARSNDTVIFYLDNDADLYATGNTYGFGVGVTRTNYDNSVGDYTDSSKSAIEAGQITIAYKGPAVNDYATQQYDVELLRFDITSQVNAEVRSTGIKLTSGGTDADADGTDEGGLIKNTASVNYTDIKLVDATTGAIIAGPKDLSSTAAADDDDQTLTYTDIWNLTAGTTKTIKVTADIASFTPAANETIKAELVAFTGTSVKNLDTNLFVATSEIVPSGAVTGSTHNVKTGSLTSTKAATPALQTYINGTSGVAVLGINFAAGTGKDVKINSIKLTAVGADSCATETACVSSVSLWDGTTQVGQTRSLSTDTVTFSNLNYVVTKGSTKTLIAKVDLNKLSTVGASTTLHLDVTSGANDVSAQDLEGNTVANSGNITGPAHVITGNGTINATLAGDDADTESQIVLTGSTDKILAKYRFSAVSEDLKVTKMRVVLPANTEQEVVSLSLWDGATRLTNDTTVTVAGNPYVDFNTFIADFVVPKDSYKTMTVKATLGTISGGATSGTAITATLDYDDNFEARGLSGSDTVRTSLSGAADVTGRSMTLRKAKLTMAEQALASSIISNGSENEVYKFSATADGDASIKQLVFDVTLTDNEGTANTLTAGSWRLFKGSTDITTLVDIHGIAGTTVESTNTLPEGTNKLIVTWTDEDVISTGSTVTYTLRSTLSGFTTGADDDSIRVVLNADSAAISDATFTKLVDLDQTASQKTAGLGDGTVTASQHSGTAAASPTVGANIIWSDWASTAHLSTLADTTGDAGGDTVAVSTSSADWINGYLLKSLPFSGRTMTN